MKERKILVPLDGSPTSTQTIKSLIVLQENIPSPLTLLHVLDLSMLSYRGFAKLTFAEIEEKARQEARQFLDEQQGLFAAAGMAVETIVKEGPAREVICKLADSGEYDLLVIGRTPLTDARKGSFGQISNEIVRHVKCPVLVV